MPTEEEVKHLQALRDSVTDEEVKQLSKIRVSEHKLPCGCHQITYADGRKEIPDARCKKGEQSSGCPPIQQLAMQTLHQHTRHQGTINWHLKCIAALSILAQGCPEHRDYRATRKPMTGIRNKGRCVCKNLWNARSFLGGLVRDEDKPNLLPTHWKLAKEQDDDEAQRAESLLTKVVNAAREEYRVERGQGPQQEKAAVRPS